MAKNEFKMLKTQVQKSQGERSSFSALPYCNPNIKEVLKDICFWATLYERDRKKPNKYEIDLIEYFCINYWMCWQNSIQKMTESDLHFPLSSLLLPATEEQEEPTPWRDLAINSSA